MFKAATVNLLGLVNNYSIGEKINKQTITKGYNFDAVTVACE